jgi:hypothetical protein
LKTIQQVFFPYFASFYCKELDKRVRYILSLDEEEKEIVRSAVKKNNISPDLYAITFKLSLAVIKRIIAKVVSTAAINVSKSTDKKSKKEFDDVL